MNPTPTAPDPGSSPRPVLVLADLLEDLDAVGTPRRGDPSDWWGWLEAVAADPAPSAWPEELRERLGGLVRTTLRFSRPGGSSVFGPATVPPGRAALLRACVERLGDDDLAREARLLIGREAALGRSATPDEPGFGADGRALAMLRGDWRPDGDFLAIDHRRPTPETRVEAQADGRPLIGPSWTAGPGASGRAKRAEHADGPLADWFEWTIPVGDARVVRSAVLLKGRKLAILADEWHGGPDTRTTRLALPPGVATAPVEGSRAIALKRPGIAARVLPLGLPALPYPTERGSFAAEGAELVLNQKADTRRSWMPLLISWDKARAKKLATWRVLTVAERSKVCPPNLAFAVRVAWSPADGLVIYRSLGKPGLRSFLGFQTNARFFVGGFNASGDVTPLLKID